MKEKLYYSKADIGILILRLCFGAGMMVHGIQKMMKFGSLSQHFPDPMGLGSTVSLSLAIFAEVVCSLFLMIGLLTPLVLVPLIITMIVAMFIVHGGDPWAKKELAFTYLAAYLAIFCSGPGQFSFDYKLFGRE